MGSEKNPRRGLKIPVIDFSAQPLKPETPEWESVRAQVRRALEEFGCFEAVFDGIPSNIRRDFFKALEEMFDFPLETKQKNVYEQPFYGYMGQRPTLPLYESFGIKNVTSQQEVESFANIFWPQGNPDFCQTIQFYTEQVLELEQIIKRMILESLGVEKYLKEHLESNSYLIRLMKYKASQATETKSIGLSPHTDKNYLTILCQNQIDGLEVQTKDGQWISVQFSRPNSFLVMIGESLHAWTNGYLYPVCHRVMMTGNEARYSVGLFSLPKPGYIVKAPKELVDQQHPLLYKPFDYLQFMQFFLSQVGRETESAAFKIYCGVTAD